MRDDIRWRVGRRLRVEKEGLVRPRWVGQFDAWHFSVGISTPRTTILVRSEQVEVTYDTRESPLTERPARTIDEFAELGQVSWEAGTWKDSSWPAGSLHASDAFDLFLDAAAALVTHAWTK